MQDIILTNLLNIGIFAMLAISLNLINGLTGMFSLGHAAFFGVGAYAAAVYMNHFAASIAVGGAWLHLPLGIVLSVFLAAILGLLVGIPCLRLTGDYLAIATLAFGEIFRIFMESLRPNLLGGPKGLRVEFVLDTPWAFAAIAAGVCATAWIAWSLKRSATGRAFLAIRENEIAAQAMGIDIASLKIQSFVLGSALAGLAGGLFALSRDQIAPADFSLMTTIMILLTIVLGGLGSITGAIAGALILGMVDPLVRHVPEKIAEMVQSPFLFDAMQKVKDNAQLFYALLLIVLIRLRPQGLFGLHEASFFFGRAKPAQDQD